MIDGHALATYKLAINYKPRQIFARRSMPSANALSILKIFFTRRRIFPKRNTPLSRTFLCITVAAVCTISLKIQKLNIKATEYLRVSSYSRNKERLNFLNIADQPNDAIFEFGRTMSLSFRVCVLWSTTHFNIRPVHTNRIIFTKLCIHIMSLQTFVHWHFVVKTTQNVAVLLRWEESSKFNIFFFHLRPGLPCGLFPWGFPFAFIIAAFSFRVFYLDLKTLIMSVYVYE